MEPGKVISSKIGLKPPNSLDRAAFMGFPVTAYAADAVRAGSDAPSFEEQWPRHFAEAKKNRFDKLVNKASNKATNVKPTLEAEVNKII